MNLHLDDKLALVTASTDGIGKAIATALACEGATVIVNGRTDARVDAAMANIRPTSAPACRARSLKN